MTGPYVSFEKQRAVAVRMEELGIREADLVERFITGSGRGGQKINKTANCVQIHHEPSGIDIRCQRSRSRELNRLLARRELCDRIEERIRGLQSARQQRIEKIRRQKRRRSRRAKERMLVQKHRHSDKKQRRAPVTADA